jgi:D-ribose pyranase
MKKIGTLNQPLSGVIAGLGHLDQLVIADAGLPIPEGPLRIDLALTEGVPGFVQTLQVVLEEMQVERAIVASEMLTTSPQVFESLQTLLPGVSIETLPHEEFKALTAKSRSVVRTGEFTPYANVILVSGVVF